MEERINIIPNSEKELVDLQAFIDVSKKETQPMLVDLLRDVENHYKMLDEYFVEYQHEDLENCMEQKIWPTQIEFCIAQCGS